MRKLILMRHGDAPNIIGDDHNRELSIDGRTGVTRAAHYLHSLHTHCPIEHILCSPVKRNKQTVELVLKAFDTTVPLAPHLEFHNEIYSNDSELLSTLVAQCNSDLSTILLLGHNPSLLEFALKCDNTGYDEWMDEINRGFMPAEIIVIEFDKADSWEDAMRNGGKIKDIFVP